MNTERVVKFLLGEGDIDGYWFGDGRPDRSGQYWWRTELRTVFDALPPATKVCRIDDEGMAILRRWSKMQAALNRGEEVSIADCDELRQDTHAYLHANPPTQPSAATAVNTAEVDNDRSIRRLFGFLDEIFGQEDAIGTEEAESHDVLRAVGDEPDIGGDVKLEYSPWMKALRASPPASASMSAEGALAIYDEFVKKACDWVNYVAADGSMAPAACTAMGGIISQVIERAHANIRAGVEK